MSTCIEVYLYGEVYMLVYIYMFMHVGEHVAEHVPMFVCIYVWVYTARASVLPAETRPTHCTFPVPSTSRFQQENAAQVAQSTPEMLIYFRDGAPKHGEVKGVTQGRSTSVAEPRSIA